MEVLCFPLESALSLGRRSTKKQKKRQRGAQKKGSKKQPLATCSLNYKGGQNGGKARLFLPAAAWKGRAWVHTEEETSALKLKVP